MSIYLIKIGEVIKCLKMGSNGVEGSDIDCFLFPDKDAMEDLEPSLLGNRTCPHLSEVGCWKPLGIDGGCGTKMKHVA